MRIFCFYCCLSVRLYVTKFYKYNASVILIWTANILVCLLNYILSIFSYILFVNLTQLFLEKLSPFFAWRICHNCVMEDGYLEYIGIHVHHNRRCFIRKTQVRHQRSRYHLQVNYVMYYCPLKIIEFLSVLFFNRPQVGGGGGRIE